MTRLDVKLLLQIANANVASGTASGPRPARVPARGHASANLKTSDLLSNYRTRLLRAPLFAGKDIVIIITDRWLRPS